VGTIGSHYPKSNRPHSLTKCPSLLSIAGSSLRPKSVKYFLLANRLIAKSGANTGRVHGRTAAISRASHAIGMRASWQGFQQESWQQVPPGWARCPPFFCTNSARSSPRPVNRCLREPEIPARIQPHSSAIRARRSVSPLGPSEHRPCSAWRVPSLRGDGVVFVHKNVMELPVDPLDAKA